MKSTSSNAQNQTGQEASTTPSYKRTGTDERADKQRTRWLRAFFVWVLAFSIMLGVEYIFLIISALLRKQLSSSLLVQSFWIATGVIIGLSMMVFIVLMSRYKPPPHAVGLVYTRPVGKIREQFVSIVHPDEVFYIIPGWERVVREIPLTHFTIRIVVFDAPTKTEPVNCTIAVSYHVDARNVDKEHLADLRHYTPEKWRDVLQKEGQAELRKILTTRTQKQWRSGKYDEELKETLRRSLQSALEGWGIVIEKIRVLDLIPTPGAQRILQIIEEARVNQNALQQRLRALEKELKRAGVSTTAQELLYMALTALLTEGPENAPHVTLQITPVPPQKDETGATQAEDHPPKKDKGQKAKSSKRSPGRKSSTTQPQDTSASPATDEGAPQE